MNYLILSVKEPGSDGINYFCVNSISRCKDSGKDVVTAVCSGRLVVFPIENVLCITPATPTFDQLQALK